MEDPFLYLHYLVYTTVFFILYFVSSAPILTTVCILSIKLPFP